MRDDLDTDGLRATGKLGFWESDLLTGRVRWSLDVDEILGLPRAGEKSLDVLVRAVVPEQRDDLEAAFARSVGPRAAEEQLEYRCHRPDGTEVWVRNAWSVHFDEQGRPELLRGVIQDITQRMRTKEALRRRTELLELLYAVTACANGADSVEQALSTSLARVCAFGRWPVGSVYRVSDRAPRELSPSGVFHADDLDRYGAVRIAVHRTRYRAGECGPGRVVESGRPAWSPSLDERGSAPAAAAARAEGLRAVLDVPVRVGAETAAVMEIFSFDAAPLGRDVMEALSHVGVQLGRVIERQRAAEALRGREELGRQILESMPIGVFVSDASGAPLFANRYALAMRGDGGRIGHLKGLHGLYVAGTDQPYPTAKYPLGRALEGQSSMVADVEYAPFEVGADGEVRPSNRRVHIECWGSPVFDEQGKVAAAVIAFYDVGERTRVERMRGELLSVVSHELRTPLTAIQGAIGLLENGVVGGLSEEAREMARIAGDGCRSLMRLVSELLDVQKLESGAPQVSLHPMALGKILEHAVAMSRPYAAALRVDLDLEDGAPGAVVLADAGRLSQVVGNLLSNAIKFTPPGERVRVVVDRPPSGEAVRVSVEDRGPGVPVAFVDRLFQKFSQADTSDARQKGGTGLGLAICKILVERMGGRIAYQPIVEGARTAGARFWFELPEMTSR